MTAQEQETIFRRWFDEHIGMMLKVVRGCAASPQDQDDLFQDVLLQIWSSIPAFRGEAKEMFFLTPRQIRQNSSLPPRFAAIGPNSY